MACKVPPLKEAIRIARAYKPGTPACEHLYAYWKDVNATLALMEKPEATFYDVVSKYEDECSIDQAAHEIADPVFGYDAFLAAKADAYRASYAGAGQ